MEAMEGAAPNDPNRSILDGNIRPKGVVPPECYCGMNAGCAISFEGGTYGMRYWCCQRIHEITSGAQTSHVSHLFTSFPSTLSGVS